MSDVALYGTGQVTFSTSSGPAPGPITVTVGRQANAVGDVDTPAASLIGVGGIVPITGWTLGGTGSHTICRDPLPGEPEVWSPSQCPPGLVPLGRPVPVPGSRPDLRAAHPEYTRAALSEWGFLLHTALLPGGGNGSYTIRAFEVPTQPLAPGAVYTPLGARTIVAANAGSAAPFGVIDTPDSMALIGDAFYPSFAWALTPQPAAIPPDGSTIAVAIDGAVIGPASYGFSRPDVAAAFPGLANSAGAGAYRWLDTGGLTSGPHTLTWAVTDDRGATRVIDSRYFRTPDSAAPPGGSALAVSLAEAVPLAGGPVTGRLGWRPDAPAGQFAPDLSGRISVAQEELGRVELTLGGAGWQGYTRPVDPLDPGAVAVLTPLPMGARVDPATGVFTWAPGAGFAGTFDFVFLREQGGTMVERREVRVRILRQGRVATGLQVVIDTPRVQQDVGQPFLLAGWAADFDAPEGTGIATLHAWAYPLSGAPPVFLGAMSYGGARPDVAAYYGEQFRGAGFGLYVQGLTPGNYDLALFPWSTSAGGFLPARVVRVTVRP